MRLRPTPRRPAIAATELAVMAPFLVALLLGVWEVGRYLSVQNTLDNAAREGGRLAASGGYFSSNSFNDAAGTTISLPPPSANSACEVQKRLLLYLKVAGINTTGATVTVKNAGTASNPKSWSYTYNQAGTITGSGLDPSAAADQLDQLTVTVTLPYSNVAWTPTSMFFKKDTVMSSSVFWQSVADIPLSVSTNIPTKPLQPSDPLP
ncbi:MAG: TadE/TadG family type IV pilus assembly protein [Gemmataceae bacterium]